ELIGVEGSVCQARATVPLRLLPPLDPISGGRAPILVTSASSGGNQVRKQLQSVQKAPIPVT
ncbi:hypothetical protein, partial [Rothia mucilaginosa]|uniref:hypothetical protein n=1 Tax=Rothia mucilaginosa TaxID=43675 RepID=UPI0026EF23BB